jgi:dihydroorotate dehydrogenase
VKATEIQRRILQRLPREMKLMACGGIGSGADARSAMDDGAALLQIYSALIFEGPGLPAEINRELAQFVSPST